MGLDQESLQSMEWLFGIAEDLNRDVGQATGDPDTAHAGVVAVLSFLAANGPVDRLRLIRFLDSLGVDAGYLVGLLQGRGLVETVVDTDGLSQLALTPAGVERFEVMADAVGGSLAQSEHLARVRERHLPQ